MSSTTPGWIATSQLSEICFFPCLSLVSSKSGSHGKHACIIYNFIIFHCWWHHIRSQQIPRCVGLWKLLFQKSEIPWSWQHIWLKSSIFTAWISRLPSGQSPATNGHGRVRGRGMMGPGGARVISFWVRHRIYGKSIGIEALNRDRTDITIKNWDLMIEHAMYMIVFVFMGIWRDLTITTNIDPENHLRGIQFSKRPYLRGRVTIAVMVTISIFFCGYINNSGLYT